MTAKVFTLVALATCLALFTPNAHAQWAEPPQTGSSQQTFEDRTNLAGQSGLAPLVTADLVDKNANADQHRAVVKVQTDGVRIVDPASVNNVPKLDQAHIQYQLDGGQIVNSTSLEMQFNNLSPGEHRVQVTLAANDNQPVGSPTTLKVHIP